jgi:hypothetical protein
MVVETREKNRKVQSQDTPYKSNLSQQSPLSSPFTSGVVRDELVIEIGGSSAADLQPSLQYMSLGHFICKPHSNLVQS